MQIVKHISELNNKPKALTLGMFDGIHRGHKQVIQFLNAHKTKDEESVLMTFSPHPREVIQSSKDFKLLSSLDEKINRLKELDLDVLFVQDFTPEFSQLSAIEFVRDILVGQFGITKLIIGHDHQFGKNREGDFEQLEEFSKIFGFELIRLPVVSKNGEHISSTKIRNYLTDGNLFLANEMLGYPYSLTGVVEKGDQLGRNIGFPTANLKVPKDKLIPKNGAYAVDVQVDGKKYLGMMNIGHRPTLDKEELRIEVHIFDFDEDIYGKEITVALQHFIREESKFKDIDTLKLQLERDKLNALKLLTK